MPCSGIRMWPEIAFQTAGLGRPLLSAFLSPALHNDDPQKTFADPRC